MDQEFTFAKFDDCIAFFKANPPVGGQVDLDFTDDEIQDLHAKAAKYDCSVDVFLNAVLACFMTEKEHRKRAIDVQSLDHESDGDR